MGTKTFDGVALTNTTIVTTAETVVATLSGVSTPRKCAVTLEGSAQITTSANTTALTPRIRRGTDATGTLIDEGNPQQVQAAAGSTETVYLKAIDENVDLHNATYVLTVEQTGASANGTALQASLSANVPD